MPTLPSSKDPDPRNSVKSGGQQPHADLARAAKQATKPPARRQRPALSSSGRRRGRWLAFAAPAPDPAGVKMLRRAGGVPPPPSCEPWHIAPTRCRWAPSRSPVRPRDPRSEATAAMPRSRPGQAFGDHFCPECGSTVFWEPARMPRLIGVTVGAFGDPSFPRPEQSVSQHPSTLGLVSPARCELRYMPSTGSPRG
jgi:hypothetical protein